LLISAIQKKLLESEIQQDSESTLIEERAEMMLLDYFKINDYTVEKICHEAGIKDKKT